MSITSPASIFSLCLGVLVLVVIAMTGLRHSRTGRVLRALPTNERAASGYGVHVVRAKLTAFAVSGFVAGLAGCLLRGGQPAVLQTVFIVPSQLVVFTATAVGGLGSALGAIMGAALVEGSTVFLPPSWQLFPSAIGVLFVLLAFPRGLAGLCSTAGTGPLAALSGGAPSTRGAPRRRGPSGPGPVEGALPP